MRIQEFVLMTVQAQPRTALRVTVPDSTPKPWLRLVGEIA